MKITHHTRFLMLDHVAVKHPPAGIVGDESDFDCLIRHQQNGVGVVHRQGTLVGPEHLEGVTVNMDRVDELAAVPQFEDIRSPPFEQG